MPCFRCSSSISSRICFCVVTSSAVVGSSAISSAGSSTSAMAIMMRWRCPPESWCGYERKMRSTSGRCTCSMIATARRRRSAAGKLGVKLHHLHDLLADAQDGVQRGHRLLEDHGHADRAQFAHLRLRQRQQVPPLKRDGPARDAQRLRQQPHDRKRGHRLARAGFADKAHRLACRIVTSMLRSTAGLPGVSGRVTVRPGPQAPRAPRRSWSS